MLDLCFCVYYIPELGLDNSSVNDADYNKIKRITILLLNIDKIRCETEVVILYLPFNISP